MKYFIGFLLTIFLIILLIFLLFHGGGNPKKAPVTPRSLPSYASTDAQVSLSTDGPINANSLHQQLKITVDKSQVTFQQFTGYNGQVVSQQSFANTEAAYSAFLNALSHAGFTLHAKTDIYGGEAGYCPLGLRYVFELNQGGSQKLRSWATSCGSPNTFRGALTLNITLFQRQVPNYSAVAASFNVNQF